MSENQKYDFAVAGEKTKNTYEYEVNKASIYLRPLVGVKYKEDFTSTGFFNNYIKGEDLYTVFVNEEYSNKKIDPDAVEAVSLAINYSDGFKGYDSNDVFQFFISDVPVRYLPDFKNVCSTKYSKTSPNFKQVLLAFYQKNAGVQKFITNRLYPTKKNLIDIARDLSADDSTFNVTLQNVFASGEVESYFDHEIETFDRDMFEPGGNIYEYVKTGGKW